MGLGANVWIEWTRDVVAQPRASQRKENTRSPGGVRRPSFRSSRPGAELRERVRCRQFAGIGENTRPCPSTECRASGSVRAGLRMDFADCRKSRRTDVPNHASERGPQSSMNVRDFPAQQSGRRARRCARGCVESTKRMLCRGDGPTNCRGVACPGRRRQGSARGHVQPRAPRHVS